MKKKENIEEKNLKEIVQIVTMADIPYNGISTKMENDEIVYGVEVDCGDWKDDHSYLDRCMSKAGYFCIREEPTEEDGSDCYSAIHYYIKPKFRSVDFDREMKAADLLKTLKRVVKECPDAIVTVRKTEGTDFPPFLTIESPAEHETNNKINEFVNQWV